MALSSVQIIAAVTEALSSNGYREVAAPSTWPSDSRLYEDEYGIVALHVFDTWQALHAGWHLAQGELVELLSARLARPDPKAWEGYLLLFTIGSVPLEARRDVSDLRYNTNRLRKLVATGDDLETVADVQTALLPLLPLELDTPSSSGSGLLARLPELLAAEGVEERVSRAAVSAFLHNESITEAIHQLGDPR